LEGRDPFKTFVGGALDLLRVQFLTHTAAPTYVPPEITTAMKWWMLVDSILLKTSIFLQHPPIKTTPHKQGSSWPW
jgi:hypothetical protein